MMPRKSHREIRISPASEFMKSGRNRLTISVYVPAAPHPLTICHRLQRRLRRFGCNVHSASAGGRSAIDFGHFALMSLRKIPITAKIGPGAQPGPWIGTELISPP